MGKNKDPAVLFYTSDFLAGTMLMNYEQKGKYITLLCLQRENGHISEEEMLQICGRHDAKIWSKFKMDEEGRYFNERMEKEVLRRVAFTESRRKSSLARFTKTTHDGACDTSYDTSYEEHTIHRMGNRNINENINSNIYSKYNNVLLTEEELKSLKKDFPKDWSERIERLGEYMASTGKSYESHYATICRWAKEDAKLEKKQGETKYAAFNPSDAMEMALKRSYGGGEYER